MRCLTATLLALAVLAIQDPGPHDLTDRFVVPAGIRVTRWAESPQVYNPTAIDVDARGRLWVTEAVNYRKWNERNEGPIHEAGDRVVILEDRDGDGVAETSTVFVQDPELVAPLGIAVLGDAVYVSCSPSLFVFRDTDGDDRADSKEVLLTGFGGRDHDHGVHSVVLGPDGRLDFNCGNEGPHVVTGPDKWTLRSGRDREVSDDGRVWRQGLALRMDRDGTGLGVVAHNFRNPYELARDAFGELWIRDNDDDGNQCCRTTWVMPGGDYGFFAVDGRRHWRADQRPDQDVWRAHWRLDDPGVAPSSGRDGAGGPTGVAIYEGGLLPEEFIGTVLGADAGRSLVFAHRPIADGAGFRIEPGVLIEPASGAQGGERAQWFRPSDVCVGADGAIYVADWYDPGVGGHASGDREAHGRILRLAPGGAPATVAADAFTDPLDALSAPSPNLRAAAFDWIAKHPTDALDRLRAALGATSKPRRIARLWWAMAACGDEGVAMVDDQLGHDDPHLRVVAHRILLAAGADPIALGDRLRDDPSPAVARELALSLRDAGWEHAGGLLVALAERHIAGDRCALEALGIGASGKEAELYAELIARDASNPIAWSDGFTEVAWRLHPTASIGAFLTRALAPGLALTQREQALSALAFATEPQAAEAMLTVAESGPDDTRNLARWWLGNRRESTWSKYPAARAGDATLGAAEELWAGDVVHAGATEIDVPVRNIGTCWLCVDDGGDGYSHDWATWGDARLIGEAGEISLSDLERLEGRTGWGQLERDRNAGGGALCIDGRVFERGIGCHAPAEMAYRIPPGFERLVAIVGPDDGGTTQPGARTSLRFRVLGVARADRSEFDAARTTLLDPTAGADARLAAGNTLAADREGGALLVALAADHRLDAELAAAIAPAIYRNPDLRVRAAASQYFPRPGRTAAKLPSIPDLAAMPGDAVRGRALYFGRALCATCHRFDGAGTDLGPDLTRIRDKYDATGLLDAILDPNAGIAFGYQATTITTTDGRAFYGFVLADGPRLVIKDTSGARHVIDADAIEHRVGQPSSLMPDGAALGLGAQDLADLVAMLRQG